MEEKCQILLLPQHRMVHISERIRETEKNATFPSSVKHICQEKQDTFNATVTQLLFDFPKHAVAHFAPFLAPFC